MITGELPSNVVVDIGIGRIGVGYTLVIGEVTGVPDVVVYRIVVGEVAGIVSKYLAVTPVLLPQVYDGPTVVDVVLIVVVGNWVLTISVLVTTF